MLALGDGEHGAIPGSCSLGSAAYPEEGFFVEAQKGTPNRER